MWYILIAGLVIIGLIIIMVSMSSTSDGEDDYGELQLVPLNTSIMGNTGAKSSSTGYQVSPTYAKAPTKKELRKEKRQDRRDARRERRGR